MPRTPTAALRFLAPLLRFLLAFALLAAATHPASAATFDAGTPTTCNDMAEAIQRIQQNNEGGTNPLMTMIPKAECWLERTQTMIEFFGINDLIPPLAAALGLTVFVASVLGAAASGVPRKLMDAAVAGVIGGIILVFSMPSATSPRGVFPSVIISSWKDMYIWSGQKTGALVNSRLDIAGASAVEVLTSLPLSLTGAGVGRDNIIGAYAQAATEGVRQDKLSQYTDEQKRLSTYTQRLTQAQTILNTPLPGTLDPSKRSPAQIAAQQDIDKYQRLIDESNQKIESLSAGMSSSVAASQARELAEQHYESTVETTDATVSSVTIAFLMVIPLLLTYAGAIYTSGITALWLALTLPFVGIAVIMGQGQAFLRAFTRHIANLLVIAVLPAVFVIAIDIAFIQPLIAVKGLFASAGVGPAMAEASNNYATAQAAMAGSGWNPVQAFQNGTQTISVLAQMIKLFIFALVVGVVMIVGSMGIATALILKAPGMLGSMMEAGFASLGGAMGLSGVAQSVGKAVGLVNKPGSMIVRTLSSAPGKIGASNGREKAPTA